MKSTLVVSVWLALAGFAGAQVDPLFEIGANDFRITFQQGTGDPDFDAFSPSVAYNPTTHEYMLVWAGTFQLPFPICPNNSPIEQEIYRQRLDAATGELLGVAGIISRSGQTCDATHRAFAPAIAYNATNNEYLVVWFADDDRLGLVDNEFEIFGQRLDALGTPIGEDDFRISDMGSTSNSTFDAFNPAVVWNATVNEYLVVWWGDDTGDEDLEIYGQRLNPGGAGQGANDFQISEMGGGSATFDAYRPDVTWNATANEYLVVWSGDDNVAGLADNEFEIFGQRLDASGGEIGDDDFRISDMGGTGSSLFQAFDPAVIWNATENEYLVVWDGDDSTNGLFENEFEIFGQRLDSGGDDIGTNDFRISDMGGTGENPFAANDPAVSWNATDSEYLVVWQGDDSIGGLVNNEFETFGQRLDAGGGEIGANDFRISDMGGTGNTAFGVFSPTPVWNSSANEYLVVWDGDDSTNGLFENEFEIFGQLLGGPMIFADGFESGDTSAWSSSQ